MEWSVGEEDWKQQEIFHESITLIEDLLTELDGIKIRYTEEEKQTIYNTILEHFPDKYFIFLAREVNSNKPIAILTLTETISIYAGGKYASIDELYVLPDYRNKQIGKLLIDAAKDKGKTRHWKRIVVTTPSSDVNHHHSSPVEFYHRENFQYTGKKLKFLLSPSPSQ